jgi:hypothetical protein
MDAKYFSYINIIDPVIKRTGARNNGTIVNVIGAGGKGMRVNALNPGATLTAWPNQKRSQMSWFSSPPIKPAM